MQLFDAQTIEDRMKAEVGHAAQQCHANAGIAAVTTAKTTLRQVYP